MRKVKELVLTLKPEDTVFIDCREPKEIQRLVDELGAHTIIIRRRSSEEIARTLQYNSSDLDYLGYNYDLSIDNDGTLDDFEESIIEFINAQGLEWY